jgi:hypothetical protein
MEKTTLTSDLSSLTQLAPKVVAPADDMFYDAAKRFGLLGIAAAGLGAIVYALQKVFFDWGWVAVSDALVLFLVGSGMVAGAVLTIGAWRTWALLECILKQYEKDAETARKVREASASVVVLGNRNRVQVNSPVVRDERQVLLQVDPTRWRTVDVAQAYEQAADPEPLLEAPKPAPEPLRLAPENLEWMIRQMVMTGNLARDSYWLLQVFPDGTPVTRGIYEAVVMALQETAMLVDRKPPRSGKFTTTDVGLVLNALAEKYPDGIRIRETIGKA